jgi:hypothetical protein
MAQLVLITCLLAEPHTCSETVVTSSAPDDVVTCIRQGETDANKWLAGNTQYTVIGWRCEKKK